jgi:hypothetical protein
MSNLLKAAVQGAREKVGATIVAGEIGAEETVGTIGVHGETLIGTNSPIKIIEKSLLWRGFSIFREWKSEKNTQPHTAFW